jgi:hypothetical protein
VPLVPQALRELLVPQAQLVLRELLVLQAALQVLLEQLVVKVLQALRELQDKEPQVLLAQQVFKEQPDHKVLLVRAQLVLMEQLEQLEQTALPAQ